MRKIYRFAVNIQRFSTSTNHSCLGCGAKFQSEFPSKKGFLANSAFPDKQKLSELDQLDVLSPAQLKLILKAKKLVCKQCKTQTPNIKYDNAQFTKLKTSSKGLVILVVDLLDLYHSNLQNWTDYVGTKDLLILVNKIDLLPDEFNFSHVKSFILGNQNTNCEGIFGISGKRGEGIKPVVDIIKQRFSQKEDVYLLGCTNVGKSTIYNHFKVLFDSIVEINGSC